MTEHQKMINKAKKVARMLQSPYENEVVIASGMLKKILDEHNLTLVEIGVESLTTKTGNEVTETKIVETLYKKPCNLMSDWEKDMIVKISRSYGVRSYSQNNNTLFIGYSGDVEILKIMIVNLRNFIQSQISKRNYNEAYSESYAFGVIDKVIDSINTTADPNKAFQLSEYVRIHYGATAEPGHSPVHTICKAYQAGQSDAGGYRKVAA